MEQVNAAQTAINSAQSAIDTIDQALESVAQESTLQGVATDVEDISGLIGTTTDTGGSTTAGSVMGKLNGLITDLSSYLPKLSYEEEMNARSHSVTQNVVLSNYPAGTELVNITGKGIFLEIESVRGGASIKILLDGYELAYFTAATSGSYSSSIKFGVYSSSSVSTWPNHINNYVATGNNQVVVYNFLPMFTQSLKIILVQPGSYSGNTQIEYAVVSD